MHRSRLRRRAVASARAVPPRPAGRLSPEAFAWLARNYAAGVEERELLDTLSAGGVPRPVAAEALEELEGPGLGAAYFAALREVDRATELAELRASLRRTAPGIEILAACPEAAEFYARYWSTNTPVVIRGFTAAWSRPPRWRFDDLRARFGDRSIEVAAGREARPDPDVDFAELRSTIPFEELLRRVLETSGNDTYVVARNRVLEEALPELLEEIEPPPGLFDPKLRRRGISLWLGPRGTSTKLHHDGTNNLFTQVLGEKLVRLVPPELLELAASANGYYARMSASEVEARHPGSVVEIELGPGDGLFIPVGWWHEVESLSPSLSLALVGFPRPNEYDFLPGRKRWRRPARS
jgi:hypothetical protein